MGVACNIKFHCTKLNKNKLKCYYGNLITVPLYPIDLSDYCLNVLNELNENENFRFPAQVLQPERCLNNNNFYRHHNNNYKVASKGDIIFVGLNIMLAEVMR